MKTVTARDIRDKLLARTEHALLDLRSEADHATGHPLFAAHLPIVRIAAEARERLPRPSCPVIMFGYSANDVSRAAEMLVTLGYTDIAVLDGGIESWRRAGYELFADVNSASKAFGEVVEHLAGTPMMSADAVAQRVPGDGLAIFDVRRPDEFTAMNIPTALSAPGAEVVLRAPAAAAHDAIIVINCAGRTRSIIGAQSLINAGVPQRVVALRNGTIGWTLAGHELATGGSATAQLPSEQAIKEAKDRARRVASACGVDRIDAARLGEMMNDDARTIYRFDVRDHDAYLSGHVAGFRHYAGGQLVQEVDMAAPVRGARIVVSDDREIAADMTASWLAQLGCEAYVLAAEALPFDEAGEPYAVSPRGPDGRYRRPYEGTDVSRAAMQAYLDWEYGLIEQLRRDGTHHFRVLTKGRLISF